MEHETLKQQLDGLQNELQLRSDAAAQEVQKLRKQTHDEVDRRAETLSKEIQALSENLDSLIGQVEGKVDRMSWRPSSASTHSRARSLS